MTISFAGAKKRKVRHFRAVFRMDRQAETHQQPAQSGLLSLVDELLLAILDQIDSKEALCNLAATCSRLQGLAEPYIWRSLLVTQGSHARHIAAALDGRDNRPSHIHELSIRYPDDQREGIEELNHFIGLMGKLRHLTIESPCPNNSEWTRNTYFDGSTRINYRALLEASVYPRAGISPALPMLQSLTLHGHGPDDRKFVFGRSAVMFFHPTLRHITLSCTNFDADITHASIPTEKKRSTPLQSLTLIECNVNVKFLDVILSLPKALKELDVGERLHVFPECNPSYDPSTRTSHPLFIDALARQADSLERLSHISGNVAHIIRHRSAETSSGRLRDLSSLKFLELGMESVLWNHLERNDFPDSVETLKATDSAWTNSTPPTDLFLRHPSKVLRRCTDIVRRMGRAVDLDVRFTNGDCEQILTTIPTGNLAVILPAILGGPVRAPVYKLATELKSRGSRLRLFVNKFSTDRTFIPPFMYGEEVPKEVQFYDSDDFWRLGGTNYRVMDDEGFQAEVQKKPRLVCVECQKSGRECLNGGDGSICIYCENGNGECVYDESESELMSI
ncbi:hypothetical protein K458DRAFT_340897 [Lentithecium fluviatile CBS 122367]|uniref:F-box domain-containing protein n=1 Tax=Lentithecium fluviatile CBS 122367 TaxID=1168545 RepID=A0A6G1IXM6_9PLEO|nr:hypothetical protein K458DRAFT_340897 [Lentithecium fluviatile CBS 122367]